MRRISVYMLGAVAIGVSTLQSFPQNSTDDSTKANNAQATVSGMLDNRKRSSASVLQEILPNKIPMKAKSSNTKVVDSRPEESDETKYLTPRSFNDWF